MNPRNAARPWPQCLTPGGCRRGGLHRQEPADARPKAHRQELEAANLPEVE